MLRAAAFLIVLALSGCATMQNVIQPTKGFYPYHAGLQQFDDAAYADAARNLQYGLDAGGLSPADQANAHKHLGFIHCVSGRERPCFDEFRKALALAPALGLAPAEAGHPVWGPVFRAAKAASDKGEPLKAEVREMAPKPEPAKLEPKSEPMFAVALRQYDDGDYETSAKTFQGALEQGLSARERAMAHKHLAFIHCASERPRPCREEFRKALAVDPTLELTPAEAGHPVWGPIFRAVKAGR
jgi:Tfp pilus assembly protein PilF